MQVRHDRHIESVGTEGASVARRAYERGASLVEYALLVALIAVVCIVSVTFVGESGSEKLTQAGDSIDNGETPDAFAADCLAEGLTNIVYDTNGNAISCS